ncbi:ISKra4 family transposase [uncultured Roseobacter sp.]|uniref:ISKra4 family transposase n=1 Tax=uncultured Roseobacter sp. TaxID=114847 RepID=UPI0026112EB5|nr:ISKra4 family transposase [uncultured Roseobacter sp.]
MKFRIKLETEFGWGETRSHEICTLERRTLDASSEDLGLCLADAKSLLKEIQRVLLQDQVEEIGEIARVCRFCGTYLKVHDRRQRRIDTLFGRVTVEVPRVRMCMCGLPGFPTLKVARSPLTRLLPDHATPELRRLQAELGARHSFREAARLLNELTPCARQNHVTIRNRLATIAEDIADSELPATTEADQHSNPSGVTVFLDSAYVRSRPEYQRRNFEIIVGSIESERREKRRFGLSVIGAKNPRAYLRRNLETAGWRDGTAVTVLSDGDPALPRLVRDATGADVRHILDWWHISIRIRHVETTFQTLFSLLDDPVRLEVEKLVQKLRWRIWHGQTARALDAIEVLFRFGMRVRRQTFGRTNDAAFSAVARTMELQTYLEYNCAALVDYDLRRRSGKAVSTSRAEGLVNDIANARMGQKRRMRWSPKGAHRVATVRAAALDGRLGKGQLRAA